LSWQKLVSLELASCKFLGEVHYPLRACQD